MSVTSERIVKEWNLTETATGVRGIRRMTCVASWQSKDGNPRAKQFRIMSFSSIGGFEHAGFDLDPDTIDTLIAALQEAKAWYASDVVRFFEDGGGA